MRILKAKCALELPKVNFGDAFWYPVRPRWQLLKIMSGFFGEGCSSCAALQDFQGFRLPVAPPSGLLAARAQHLLGAGKTAFGPPRERFYFDRRRFSTVGAGTPS